jgi:hypothetical protein
MGLVDAFTLALFLLLFIESMKSEHSNASGDNTAKAKKSTRAINCLLREYLRKKKETDDNSVPNMERRSVLSTVDECTSDTIRHS